MNWNPNSVICRVTRCIFVHHLSYHKKLICYKLRPALTISKFYMLSIKFNYAAAFYSIKTSSKLVPSVGELVWPFGNFLFVFCVFGCLTFLPFVCETFLILWNVKRGFCFATAFHCCLLILHSAFCIVSHSWSFHPHYCNGESIACIWKFVLQIGCFLLPLSILKYFLSQTEVT